MTRKKSPAEHELHGTRRRYAPAAGAATRPPRAPSHLPEDGRRLWRKLAPELAARGLLDPALDLAGLEQLCLCYSLACDAQRDIGANGAFVTAASGWRQPSPAVTTFNRATSALLKWCSAFGLTPAGRQGLGLNMAPEADDPDDLWSEINRIVEAQR